MKEEISISDSHRYRVLKIHEVTYFEVCKHNVTVFFNQESHEFSQSLSSLERMLADKGFCRIYRSILVPVDRIRSIDGRNVIMDDKEGTRLPIGSRYEKQLIEALEHTNALIL